MSDAHSIRRWLGRVALIGAVVVIALRYWDGALPKGATRGSLSFAGVERSYVLYLPKQRARNPALVLVLHGLHGSGANLEARSRGSFDALADRDGFVVVYPDALGGQWGTGHPGLAARDDVGFLSALIATLSRRYAIDERRVYGTGFSNGASMVYRVACERPDSFAAIAPVSGGLALEVSRHCANGRAVPLLVMHGTADPIVGFDSGELKGNVADWVYRNACRKPAEISRLPDTDPTDGTRVRVEHYLDCRDGADVNLYAIEGGGHQWPGGNSAFGHGNTCRDIDAAASIWQFFSEHPKR